MEFKVREDGIIISFPYNQETISKIREVSGREFLPGEQVWRIPLFALGSLKEKFEVPEYIEQEVEQKRKQRLEIISNGLNPKLLPFQKEGVAFLVEKQKSFLCADMGLGKTAMSISYAELLFTNKLIERVFIVCPKSLVSHWIVELNKFTVNPEYLAIHGTKANRIKQWASAYRFKYILTNYEQLRDMYNFERFNHYMKFPSLIVLDEATRIKNRQAQVSRQIKRLDSKFKVVLSGRPLENRPEELYSINEFLKNGVLGSWSQFEQKYIVKDVWGKPSYYIHLDDLADRIRPIVFRCRKQDVLTELPERIDKNYYVSLSNTEHKDYKRIVDRVMERLAIYRTEHKDFHEVLGTVQIAKMFCDHPDLVKESESHTAKQLTIETKNSTKFDEFFNIIDEISDKVVVFTQYTKMAEKLHNELEFRGYKSVLVTGKTKDRDAEIEKFRNESQILISTEVLGYGINLQFASYIINYDMPWNPATLEQRIARLHRMGQKNVVNVINLIVEDEDKIEQKIRKTLGYKDDLFKQVFGE